MARHRLSQVRLFRVLYQLREREGLAVACGGLERLASTGPSHLTSWSKCCLRSWGCDLVLTSVQFFRVHAAAGARRTEAKRDRSTLREHESLMVRAAHSEKYKTLNVRAIPLRPSVPCSLKPDPASLSLVLSLCSSSSTSSC
jgi:hypothetical protein